MRGTFFRISITAFLSCLVIAAIAQEAQAPDGSAKPSASQERAASTRTFLGLGTPPDKAAAVRAEPLYQQNCAFCHGQKARGATAPALITSDVVLADDHGEHLAPFLKAGRPEKGMPSFSQLSGQQRIDLAEYLHQQVEDVANRGAYHLPNILVGNAALGKSYVATHCMSCHTAGAFAHIASRFRSADQLQRYWVWPAHAASAAITATVKLADGATLSGRVTQISDFRITLVSANGEAHAIDRSPHVDVQLHDPLAPHQALVNTLQNDAMHNVTAYLETLQ